MFCKRIKNTSIASIACSNKNRAMTAFYRDIEGESEKKKVTAEKKGARANKQVEKGIECSKNI
ncbi:hypothetical protein CWS01_05060 [Niallia nealsonii]|uniref:Uncharacterized protein n=1 Tax=Niallia nealsonii TaxID=115979 RepID=A0A2N0Z534_9BACI|nr:hypothetical protein CWS01_05060 [Niallia nealsonii]